MAEVRLDKSKGSGRERLVQAARSLAQQATFDEITIDEIVKAADLSRPAFYYHFSGGKEELRSELVRSGYLGDVPTTDIRQDIVEAALRVFGRSGVTAATLEDIASEAGVSRGTLCWYYRSKDDLLKAIVQRHESYQALRQVLEDIEQDLQNGVQLDDETFLRRIAGGFYDSLTAQSDLTRLPILLLHTHPEVAQFLANEIVRKRKYITEYVEKRQEAGAFSKHIDAAFFVQIIAMSFYMRAVACGLSDFLPFARLSREEAIHQLVSLLLYGIVQRNPTA
jgi:AcrR family transcriptional regulator